MLAFADFRPQDSLVHSSNKGTPSLAGRPLFQNSPPDCFGIHPLPAEQWAVQLAHSRIEGALPPS